MHFASVLLLMLSMTCAFIMWPVLCSKEMHQCMWLLFLRFYVFSFFIFCFYVCRTCKRVKAVRTSWLSELSSWRPSWFSSKASWVMWANHTFILSSLCTWTLTICLPAFQWMKCGIQLSKYHKSWKKTTSMSLDHLLTLYTWLYITERYVFINPLYDAWEITLLYFQ